jgi:hypothetical protein
MSGSEKKIEDTQGQYMLAVREGRDMNNAEWQQCRVVLTDQRFVIIGEEKTSLPLEEIDELGDRYDVNRAATRVGNYSALHVGENVYLVTTEDHETFETNFFRAVLDGAIVYVKYPAVVGGVVQSAEWQRGRTKVSKEEIRIVLEDGQKFLIDRDDIGDMDTDEKEVAGERRAIIEVEHTDDEGNSVETHLSGQEYHISVLKQLLEEGAQRNRANLDLSPVEQRVVMALYSGVSPFAISEFVGLDPDRVEEIYDQLIELDVVEVVRERKEVVLTAQGRTVAGEKMGER